MAERKYYPPHDIDKDEEEECIHGIPVWANCDECAKDDEGDERYHAAKDDGAFLRDEDSDSMYDESVEPPLGQEWGR